MPASKKVEELFAPRFDMGTVLNVLRKPVPLRSFIIALVEERLKGLQYE